MPPSLFFVGTGFHHVDQSDLELLDSRDLPTSASQSAGIIGMSDILCLALLLSFQPALPETE